MASSIKLVNNNGTIFKIDNDDTETISKELSFKDFTYIVDTIKDLSTLSNIKNGEVCFVKGYHDINDGAGGKFIWNENENCSNHNGGTIIDPKVSFPNDWSNSNKVDLWLDSSTGNGCWIREDTMFIEPKWFGFTGVEEQCLYRATTIGKPVYLTEGTYTLNDTNMDFSNEYFFSFGIVTINNDTINVSALVKEVWNRDITITDSYSGFILVDRSDTTKKYRLFVDNENLGIEEV